MRSFQWNKSQLSLKWRCLKRAVLKLMENEKAQLSQIWLDYIKAMHKHLMSAAFHNEHNLKKLIMNSFFYFTYTVENTPGVSRNSYSEGTVTLNLSFTWRLLKEIWYCLFTAELVRVLTEKHPWKTNQKNKGKVEKLQHYFTWPTQLNKDFQLCVCI